MFIVKDAIYVCGKIVAATEFSCGCLRTIIHDSMQTQARLGRNSFDSKLSFIFFPCSFSDREETFSSKMMKNIFLPGNKKGNEKILKTWSVSFLLICRRSVTKMATWYVASARRVRVNNLCFGGFCFSCRFEEMSDCYPISFPSSADARLQPAPNKYFKYSNKINYVLEGRQAEMGTWLQDDPTQTLISMWQLLDIFNLRDCRQICSCGCLSDSVSKECT